MVNREWLKERIEEYLATMSDTHMEEWYVSDRDLADFVLGGFESFLFGADDAKEARRKQWEELNKEFGS